MQILIVTEKCTSNETQRDGGARVVETLQRIFPDCLSVMQFGPKASPLATWHFDYPFNLENRFENRVANARYIARKVKDFEKKFTHVIFIHISMQFGLVDVPLDNKIHVWTFPMFLTPSYLSSGERVPDKYTEMERLALAKSKNIITPSHFEKRQLIDIYSIPREQIHVVPRGVNVEQLVLKERVFNGVPKFCSVGSVKPQKNTVELIRLFKIITISYPDAVLKIIGAIQDRDYFKRVLNEVETLDLGNSIEFTGYVSPNKLSLALQDSHLHLSRSTCETFGRTTFETLACGLPNVGMKTGNAAIEFLEGLPYARFTDGNAQAMEAIQDILNDFSTLSSMALEIGELYNEEGLSKLLSAKIFDKQIIAITDYDGTLFHKNDPKRTQRSMKAFKSFQTKVICSARSTEDLLAQLKEYQLEVDWIVAFSGAVVTNGSGEILWSRAMSKKQIDTIKSLVPEGEFIQKNNETLQISMAVKSLRNFPNLRVEVYQDTAFVFHWEASKFRAVHRLLRYLDWSGQVLAFGDGPYDNELLNYFDGIKIIDTPDKNSNQQREIKYV